MVSQCHVYCSASISSADLIFYINGVQEGAAHNIGAITLPYINQVMPGQFQGGNCACDLAGLELYQTARTPAQIAKSYASTSQEPVF